MSFWGQNVHRAALLPGIQGRPRYPRSKPAYHGHGSCAPWPFSDENMPTRLTWPMISVESRRRDAFLSTAETCSTTSTMRQRTRTSKSEEQAYEEEAAARDGLPALLRRPVPASHRASAVVGPRGATFYVWVLGAPHVQRWKLWPAWPTRTSFFMRLVQARWPSETL